ncbi:hypothetical protein ACWCQ1_42560 [Streptomyces sp. NPDC002144]|uniref:hypothetical protein n=1 Tax=Streptomyces sp. NPDC006668 TaxID=3156903 RepID=UPI0010D456C6
MLRTAPVLILDEPTAGDLRLTAQADLVLHLTDAAATLATGPHSATRAGAEHDAASSRAGPWG